jgi:hypothetical protein
VQKSVVEAVRRGRVGTEVWQCGDMGVPISQQMLGTRGALHHREVIRVCWAARKASSGSRSLRDAHPNAAKTVFGGGIDPLPLLVNCWSESPEFALRQTFDPGSTAW